MLKSCTSITERKTGLNGWENGDERLGFVVSPVPKCEGQGGTHLSAWLGLGHSQRPYGAHEFVGRVFPGLRRAPSGAIVTSSLREEWRRVGVHRPPRLRIEMRATRPRDMRCLVAPGPPVLGGT
jgi:hypothetical protein